MKKFNPHNKGQYMYHCSVCNKKITQDNYFGSGLCDGHHADLDKVTSSINILGFNAARNVALSRPYGANMLISAALVVELTNYVEQLEARIKKANALFDEVTESLTGREHL